jgi:hypothetical protein
LKRRGLLHLSDLTDRDLFLWVLITDAGVGETRDHLNVRVAARSNATTGAAFPAWALVVLAVESLCQAGGECQLADVGWADEQVGVCETISVEAMPQQANRPGLTGYLPHATCPQLYG